MVRRTLTVLAIVAAFMLAVPAASAAHWSLYYSGLDDTPGATREDDAAAITSTGTPFDGRQNRVVYPGNLPGDGTLFLDARVGDATPAPTIYGDRFGDALFGRSDMLPPGLHHVSAWYGQWLDKNQNGFIEDLPLSCVTCPEDEFAWRGAASGDSSSMVHFTLPSSAALLALGSSGSWRTTQMTDHTLEDEGWTQSVSKTKGASVNDFGYPIGDSFIVRVETLTLAGAERATGTPLGYVLDDPNALYDVDQYDALNPDVESAYLSAVAGATGPAFEIPTVVLTIAIDTASAVIDIVNAATKTVGETLEPADATIRETTATITGLASARPRVETHPYFAKEPNHMDDDFEGRALFGGVGDIMGSYNSYTGYEQAYHFYFDNLARFIPCAGAHASAPGTAIERGTAACLLFAQESPTDADPRVEPASSEPRSTGALLTFQGLIMLWRDTNRDTHVGAYCSGDGPDGFDAERNTCKNPRGQWPNWWGSNTETVDACPVVHSSMAARGVAIEVSPVGGDWPPGVVVVRDQAETTRVAQELHWEVPLGSDPVTLRWTFECNSGGHYGSLLARGVLLFPTGKTPIPIRVEARATIEGYSDSELGIGFGFESVTDVDVLPATETL